MNNISGKPDLVSKLKFIENNKLNYNKDYDKYITFGKGYP